MATYPALVGMRCGQCGWERLEPGFLTDMGQGSFGYGRWVQGLLEVRAFGRARLWRRPKWPVTGYRCERCGHLELFAAVPE